MGLTTVDIILAFAEYPHEDTKNTALQYTSAAGGPASNAAVVFSFLGGDARLVSSLGRTSIADIARQDLLHSGVRHFDTTPTRDLEPALSAIAIAQATGSRTILTSPAIDEESPISVECETPLHAAVDIDILLVDGHQAAHAIRIARIAKSRGVPIVLDGDLFRPDSESILKLVDIVIFGKSFRVPGEPAGHAAFRYFRSFGIQHVIATNGADPLELESQGVHESIPVPRVPKAVDTLAAGDFFHGAFCYSFSIEPDIRQASRFAAKVASSSVALFGTRHWMTKYAPSDFTRPDS